MKANRVSGFLERSCRNMLRVFVIILGLFLLASTGLTKPNSNRSGVVYLRADFDAIGDGVADDTEAILAFFKACARASCFMEQGRYRVTRSPPKFDHAITLVGAGLDVTQIVRDYDGEKGRGFLHFEGVKDGQGPYLARFSIISAPVRSGGHALAAFSTETENFGNMRVEHVKFSTDGVDSWDSTILIDGSRKKTGARGVRSVLFHGCQVFGAQGYSMVLKGVIDFRFDGGIYAAGGSGPYTGGIKITGNEAVKSQGVMLIGNAFGYLNLSYVTAMKVIAVVGIAGNQIDGVQRAIDAAQTVDRVQILDEPYGLVSVDWTNSSIILPSGKTYP